MFNIIYTYKKDQLDYIHDTVSLDELLSMKASGFKYHWLEIKEIV